MAPTCNICGVQDWQDMNARKGVRCGNCKSLERTRALKLLLDHHKAPKAGATILHFAPERSLAEWIKTTNPGHYDMVDIAPERYKHSDVRRFDATTDCETLPDNHYDLIIHNHVLEHIPCNIAYMLFHLSRALKPDGFHVFSIPIMKGHYAEDFAPLTREEATERFGQFDHLRRFSRDDIHLHLAKLMNIDLEYSLYKTHDAETLDAANIPEHERTGLKGSTIFVTKKSDYLLR